MRKRLRSVLLLLSCLSLVVLLTGCPKRPVATVASAPAPAAPSPPPPLRPRRLRRPPRHRHPRPRRLSRSAARPGPGATATARTRKEFRQPAALKNIHFDFDKSVIRPEDAAILRASADYLKANPTCSC